MTDKVIYTHKGWLAFCPIHLGGDMSNPEVVARFYFTDWLLQLAFLFSETIGMVMQAIDPFAEVGYPIRVTGKLVEPYEVDYDEEDDL